MFVSITHLFMSQGRAVIDFRVITRYGIALCLVLGPSARCARNGLKNLAPVNVFNLPDFETIVRNYAVLFVTDDKCR